MFRQTEYPGKSEYAFSMDTERVFERRMKHIQKIFLWNASRSEPLALHILVDLIFQRNVIPELNNRRDRSDRILALGLYSTLALSSQEYYMIGDEKKDIALVTAHAVAKSSLLYDLYTFNRRKRYREHVLLELRHDMTHARYLTEIASPIITQVLYSKDESKGGMSDSRKFELLSQAIFSRLSR